MLDIAIIRDEPDRVRAAMRDLQAEDALPRIDAILELDERRRESLAQVEALKAERKRVSKQIGRMKDEAEREAKIAEMRPVAEQIDALDEGVRQVEGELNEHMLWIPNLPAEGVPVGADENENVLVRQEGDLPSFDFEPLPHWDLGPMLDIIDFERGVKLSGSRFYVLKGLGARLQRALITWMIDLHVNEHGYSEVYPPFMVRGYCMEGTGNLPKFSDTLYHDIEEDFWWVPTAEVPVTNLHREEIIEPDVLPLRYVAYTPCFRREKMAAGRDVRGIKRGHQFDKVEMVNFTEADPEVSEEALQQLVRNAEKICRRLGITHRVIQMCTGDLAFAAAKKYDVEMWAPGCQEWLEVSSCSNFHDFQARRAGIRYRPARGEKPRYAHTLNGSGLALPRVMIAVLETYQQQDGSVVIPEVLRPYMGGMEIIRAPGA
jgi:seryl-tRNA synthetase